VPRQAGIDQSLNGAADVIAVAVVVIQVCPFINIDVFGKFHDDSFNKRWEL
jgi:hypothetical protein